MELSRNSTHERAARKRASKACRECRMKKVRCDVVITGPPCTKCRFDDIHCVVSEGRRNKKRKENHPSQVSGEDDDDLYPSIEDENTDPSCITVHSQTFISPPVPNSDRKIQSDETRRSLFHEGNHNPLSGPSSGIQPRKLSTDLGIVPPPQTPRIFQADIRQMISLPGYIKPIPQSLSQRDLEYLWQRGALSIPEDGLDKELLCSYVEFVHGYLPVLGLHDFIQAISCGDGQNGTISLMLFQAVMFAGTGFVAMSRLKSAGYNTRKEARRAFFSKVRCLYDFDCEDNRISVIQTLLLMTYFYENSDEQKDPWHWMGVAVSLAYVVGLHQNPQNSMVDEHGQRISKRLWWSCFMRDRLIALELRKPCRIRDDGFDVPMLCVEDFEIQAVPSGQPGSCAVMEDVEEQRQIAIMCIEKAKLCLCIKSIPEGQFAVINRDLATSLGAGHQIDASISKSRSIPSKNLNPDADEILRYGYDLKLTNWYRQLPGCARYRPSTMADLAAGGGSIVLHRGQLHMIYLAAVSALHRSAVPPVSQSKDGFLNGQHDKPNVARDKVRVAAMEITHIVLELQSLGLVDYLPPVAVTVLLHAVISHLLDVASLDMTLRKSSLEAFHHCIQVMEGMGDKYEAADFYTRSFEAVIQKVDVRNADMDSNKNCVDESQQASTLSSE